MNENETKWAKGQKVYRAEFDGEKIVVRELTVVAVGKHLWMVADDQGSRSGGAYGWMRRFYATTRADAVVELRERMRESVVQYRRSVETAEAAVVAAFGKESLP